MRSMMSISDAGTRYPQKFRIVCSAGEPPNPEAIRWFREQYGLPVLDHYGLTESYPLVANYPFADVHEGVVGDQRIGLGQPVVVEHGEAVLLAEPADRLRVRRLARAAHDPELLRVAGSRIRDGHHRAHRGRRREHVRGAVLGEHGELLVRVERSEERRVGKEGRARWAPGR